GVRRGRDRAVAARGVPRPRTPSCLLRRVEGVTEPRLGLRDARRISLAAALRGPGPTEQLGEGLFPRRFELLGVACETAAPRDAGARAEIPHVRCVGAEA